MFGGGTDLPEYRREFGSTILSFAINKHMYVTHNERPTGDYRISYSEVEELESLKDAKHTLVCAAAEKKQFNPCTLTITSDVPKGTGLGSSSALSVCLAKLANWKLEGIKLVNAAYQLESSVSPVGMQDHLPAVLGDIHIYHLGKRPHVFRYGGVPPHLSGIINEYGLLLYTGRTRDASNVLKNWDNIEALHAIKVLADEVVKNLKLITIKPLAEYLDKTWELKRTIGGVTDALLDVQHRKAKLAGALGGKLCGAGAGGCWFFLVDGSKRKAVIDTLGLSEIPIKITTEGCKEWEGR